MEGPLIELKDIYKIYQMGGEEVRANDGISLTVERGEFVAIVGKSGSGKSTLMNIIGALDENGMPNRWKIENSWGDKSGEKGYYVCSDSWFDGYVYQAAVEREYLGGLAALAEQEPAVLEPWDPMGTLAD